MADESDQLAQRMERLLHSLGQLVEGDAAPARRQPSNLALGRTTLGRRNGTAPPPSVIKAGLHTCRVMMPSNRQRTLCRACAGYDTTRFPNRRVELVRPASVTAQNPSTSLHFSNRHQESSDGAMREIYKALLRIEGSLEQQHVAYGAGSMNADTLLVLRQVQRQVETLGEHVGQKKYL